MNTFYIVLFSLLGLIFGSFYNVVGVRLSKGQSIVYPRSHCVFCKHTLSFFELIPVLSYIFLRGRCKVCKNKISIMYPLIEVFTGVLFGLSFYVYGFSIGLILSLLLSSLFIIVVVTDLNYYIIPDSIVIIFGVLFFIYNIISKGFLGACTHLVYGLVMFMLMYLIMLLGNYLFKEESLGGGDIKLMGILGMISTPIVSICSLALSAFIALPTSLFFLFFKKDKIIPFGPFLVAASLIIMFMKIDASDIINFLINK